MKAKKMINPELIMKLTLQRIHDNGTSTLGIMYLDGEFLCYTLEDTFRAEKVDGKTRIPAGEYVIATREVMSPLTEKYREQYDYFSYHLELQEVPNFQYVYIHIGNWATDTEGCILVGAGQQLFPERMITHSTQAYKSLYNKIESKAKAALVTIEVLDERA